MKVPLVKPDLPPLEALAESIEGMLSTGAITNFGPCVQTFERELEDYLGVPALTVTSGTAALILALQNLGVRPGQKVIVPSFTFVASVQAILYAGAVPVFGEVGPDLTLDPEDLAYLLDAHADVAAVLPVHTFGLPARVYEIQAAVTAAAAVQSRPIHILYDAAHALGSSLDGRKVATFGNAEAFSLSATKVLVAVEGGLVSSHDADFMARLRKARNYGIEANYDAHQAGLNGKMTEFNAAVGTYNLRRLDELIAMRTDLAHRYREQLLATSLEPLQDSATAVHTYKDFSVFVPVSRTEDRDRLLALLQEQGVECRKYFSPPAHRQQFFRRYADRDLPATDDASARVITLPFFTSMLPDALDYVIGAIHRAEVRLGWR